MYDLLLLGQSYVYCTWSSRLNISNNFEESWKVLCLSLFGWPTTEIFPIRVWWGYISKLINILTYT